MGEVASVGAQTPVVVAVEGIPHDQGLLVDDDLRVVGGEAEGDVHDGCFQRLVGIDHIGPHAAVRAHLVVVVLEGAGVAGEQGGDGVEPEWVVGGVAGDA